MLDFATGQLTRKEVEDLRQQLKMQHQVSSDAKKAEADASAALGNLCILLLLPVSA